MTTIKVDFYKASGKWYTSEMFSDMIEVFETKGIILEIYKRFPRLTAEMAFTFEAENDNKMINKQLVR